MKFLRICRVVLAVAVIVGLGMLWAHASGGGTGPRRAPSHEALLRLEQVRKQVKGGVIRVHSDRGFNLANTGNLIRTSRSRQYLRPS